MNPDVLNSWKEIAQYLNRGVRTVQRWENDFGLPVRRPRARRRSAVIALKSDIEKWWQQSPLPNPGLRAQMPRGEPRTSLAANRECLHNGTRRLYELASRMNELSNSTRELAAQLVTAGKRSPRSGQVDLPARNAFQP